MNSSILSSVNVNRFPGAYYDQRVRTTLRRQVMSRWPAPKNLLRMWNDETLTERQRVALLLGGAAFNDPVLLPAYREGIDSRSERIRQAAAYGFRDLLADWLPDVSEGVDENAAKIFAEEMEAVARTLETRTLLELWIHSALATEGSGLPGWQGVTFHRSVADCFRAAELLVDVNDLDFLVNSYELTRDLRTMGFFMKLIEAVSLSRFVVGPTEDRQAWGTGQYIDGLRALNAAITAWRGDNCTVDYETVLRRNLAREGVVGIDPLSIEGCLVWQTVLVKGKPSWWMVAARRLYACGGPRRELSAIRPDDEKNIRQRRALASWFRLLETQSKSSSTRK